MKRTMMFGVAILTAWLASASISQAQVFIRAPFVRVAVGNGVAVRAPFVNLFIPSNDPVYGPVYGPYGPPRVIYGPPPVGQYVPPMPAPNQYTPPPPQVEPPATNQQAPPPPIQTGQAPTLQSFAKSFQAKQGAYEVTLLNPVTRQPTTVRFTLPEGTPRRVNVSRDEIEFFYGLRKWVRIQFDRDGAVVSSR